MAEESARKRAEPKVLESKTFKDGAIFSDPYGISIGHNRGSAEL